VTFEELRRLELSDDGHATCIWMGFECWRQKVQCRRFVCGAKIHTMSQWYSPSFCTNVYRTVLRQTSDLDRFSFSDRPAFLVSTVLRSLCALTNARIQSTSTELVNMTIGTPFYFVICIEDSDDTSPQPLMDAEQYHHFFEHVDDNSSYSSSFTDFSDDSIVDGDDSIDDDCDMEVDVAPSNRNWDGLYSSELSPTLDNDEHSCLLSGFEEWEESLNDCPSDSDDADSLADSLALARKRVRRSESYSFC
jgi:hypothetical protein